LSPEFKAVRSVTINAPADRVYALLADPREWKRWSVWNRRGPALTPEGYGTKVTWTMNGNMGTNPLLRWIALFGDKMVGADFEAGLANLKAIAEKP
jgi:uncharacterized protein YndB with AHSA1/START domain